MERVGTSYDEGTDSLDNYSLLYLGVNEHNIKSTTAVTTPTL